MSLRMPKSALPDHDAGAWAKARKQAAQRGTVECDASSGRSKARPRHVNEHRASAAGDSWTAVVVQLDDQVVEAIGSPEPVAGMVRRKTDWLVVAAVGRVFAPAVVAVDAPDRQARARAGCAVGSPPQPPESERAARRTAIAFALIGFNAAAPKRNRERKRSCDQPTAAAVSRLGTHADGSKRGF